MHLRTCLSAAGIAFVALVVSAGCGGSSSTPASSTPPSPPPAVTVSVSPASATVQAGGTQAFTATVANDPADKGVNWTVSCSATPCGMVSPTSTPSGTPTTYTAPSMPPASNLAVTLTATSISDTTKSNSAIITVPAIGVSVKPASGLIPVNVTQQFTATVSNDPSNKGVTWSLAQNGTACSSVCGTVSPTMTASGAPTTYTAPATVPANATVTINATSVADTTKPANATITVTNGTVKLIPASLNFDTVKIDSTSAPQTITLTNTGSAALTINSITITGTNAGDFSQTNDCNTSVGAGNSCTITVTFKPTASGSRSANVTISDSSADSPQQVALSGTGEIARITNAEAARSALAGQQSAAVPIPMGPDTVGTRVMHLVDSTRDDPYLANGTKRELGVRFWYPASINLNQNCKPAEYASPAVWKYFSQLVGVRPFPVATNSCLNAPITDGVHPVVVFTPGYTATFTDYTFLLEDLASRGYVVASVAHTYETTAVEFPDGRLVRSVVGSHLGGTLRGDDQALSFAVYVRLQDLEFVLNELGRLNAQPDSPFANKLDMSNVAIAGHSLGGLTAFLSVELDPRFRAGVILDGYVPEPLVSVTKTPVFILAAGRKQWDASECHLWSNLKGLRLAVNLRGSEHVALSDWIWLAKDAIETGPMGPEKTMTAVRDYVAAFLDANLRAMALNPTQERLLTGPSSDYPGAAVTTQEQRLRAKP
jgi:dienelactone hydrolase